MDTTVTLDDMPIGSMRMVRVEGHRVCLVRTESGVHAIDHACPHEGYGLTQGELDGDVLTCAWHNWKFRVSDGRCLLGEEDVLTHPTQVGDDGTVHVTVRARDPEVERPRLIHSLRSGIERQYTGQVARDVVRLLRADTDPGELVWQAVAYGAPRAEFGWGHSIASATDCLAMLHLYDGDQRALPIVQGIMGIAESERGRPEHPLPSPVAIPRGDVEAAGAAFRRLVEAERTEDAQALLLGALHDGAARDHIRAWFTAAVSDHHLGYGHGAIYTQKGFQLLDMIGWDRATTVLPHLVTSLVTLTREDKLPYLRPFVRAMQAHDLADLAMVAPVDTWADDGRLLDAMLGSDRVEPLDAAVAALGAGAGVDRVLDVVVEAVSERMLRYDVAGEWDFHDDFGWLDITHGLTLANAVRWHHAEAGTSAETIRMALWAVFLASWTGRHEWHAGVGPRVDVERSSNDLRTAGEDLQRAAQLDGTTAFIVHAHAVKTSVAAAEEAMRSGSWSPIDATARFLAAPKLERFVAATVTRSIDFLSGRTEHARA